VVQNEVLSTRLALQPPLLQVLVVNLVERDPARAAFNLAEEPVAVLAPLPVKATPLVGRAETRGGLLDVDVGEYVGRGVGRLRRRLVLVNVEFNTGQADGLADKKANALEREDRLGAVREGLVLRCVSVS